jgi:hypothetical protein
MRQIIVEVMSICLLACWATRVDLVTELSRGSLAAKSADP